MAFAFALGAFGTFCARSASADEADEIRDALVRGTPATWPTTFRRIDSNPALIGRVLGPLFRDKGNAARAPSAWTAATLASRAKKGDLPLLSDDILRRASGDEEWLTAVRSGLDPEGNGWASIVRAASLRSKIASGDAADRLAAIFLLRHDPSKSSAQDLAEAWAGAPPAVAAMAREALAASLGSRFESADAAKRWMAERAGVSFVDWVRELSAAKDRPDAAVYRRMIVEAKQNLERVTTLAELARYLSSVETPFVEVRRLAAARAARVEATGEAWLPLLVDVLRHEGDRETLAGLVAVARKIRVTGGGGADLADAILARLPESGGSGELTLGLLDLLTGVADRRTVSRAFDVLGESADAAVKEALLSLAGAVGGNEAILCGFHGSLAAKTDATSIRLRVRALEALAEGAKASKEDSFAAVYLRAVLRRDATDPAEAKLPLEGSGPGRQAAVRALEAFPSAATAKRLAEIARAEVEDSGLSRLAALVLGKIAARGDAAAGAALLDLAADAALRGVRAEAVRALAKLPQDAPDDVRARAKAAVRAALDPAGSRDLRAAAVEVAAALADEGAWEGSVAFAVEMAREAAVAALRPALEGLTRELAQANGVADARLSDAFRRLADAGAVEVALTLANEAAEMGAGRPALQVARADLLRSRAAMPTRDPADRRKDLLDADQIVRTVIRAAPVAEQAGAAWGQILRLRSDVLEHLLDDPGLEPPARKTALLAAIETASLRHDPEVAKEGLSLLAAARARGDLTSEEAAALDREEEALRNVSKATPQ